MKGPGDKLSTKQRLWLDFFSKNDVEAKVCHVVGMFLITRIVREDLYFRRRTTQL